MAKMITRTITIYTYTTGTVNFQTMKVENTQNHSFPYKLGQRALRDLAKNAGNPVIATTEGQALYGMTLEDFIKYAKPIEDDSNETGLEFQE